MTKHPGLVIPRGAESLFHSLSDPSRLAIIACLAHGEHCVKELTGEVGLAQSTVSEHISCLRNCGLVVGRPQGRQMRYSLACPEVLTLLRCAEQVLQATGYQVDDCPRYGRAARTNQGAVGAAVPEANGHADPHGMLARR
ncbi:MAG: metalloregulator ArsR/SmtB family transcription factor [Propionibacteriaceae bacterium]|jgi:DNA-binding transcriptional ArsR family regulator|nr:metalloregulator ArsR/SmtB family transcription factor [Propionibacteriaceae bacterium]